MRWVVAALVVALLLAACTSDPAAKTDRPVPSSPPPWVTETRPPEITTRPLVLAMNARRPPIAVAKAVAEWIQQGVVTNWRDLGQPAAPIRLVDRTDSLR